MNRRTIQPCGTGCIDDAAELLLPEVRPSCLGARESASQMDIHDLIPFLVGHVPEPVVGVRTLAWIFHKVICLTPCLAGYRHCLAK